MNTRIDKTDAEWRAELTPAQYTVLRRRRTDLPFVGEYVHTQVDGVYCCAACGAASFSSETCGGHLGHVFGDGPGGCDRCCSNSVALDLDSAMAAA